MTKTELASAIETELHAKDVLMPKDHFLVMRRVKQYNKALLEYQYDMAVLARNSRGVNEWLSVA